MQNINYKKEEIILSVNNVELTYDDTKRVLKDINLQIHNITRPDILQGQIISIVGKSGCGKSSLFKLLSGFLKPTLGEVKLGVDQKVVEIGEVGVVPQDYPLFNHRTIRKNFELAIQDKKNRDFYVNDYAKHFDLLEHLDKYPSELSGGQRQRAAIIQQVLAGNKTILCDEIFSGLDSIMKDKVMDLLIKISHLDEMSTLIIISHDIEAACCISDTVYVLADKDGNGSTIIKTYDLIGMGLAYQPDIKHDPEFIKVINEIKTIM